MGFFSELKEDFSQAVSELGEIGDIGDIDDISETDESSDLGNVEDGKEESGGTEQKGNKQAEKAEKEGEGKRGEKAEKEQKENKKGKQDKPKSVSDDTVEDNKSNSESKEEETMGLFNDDNVDKDFLDQMLAEEGTEKEEEAGIDDVLEAALSQDKTAGEKKKEKTENAAKDEKADKEKEDSKKEKEEEEAMVTPAMPDPDLVENNDIRNEANQQMAEEKSHGTVTVITKGTIINGGISSDGSLEVMGTITGDVECLGKLSIIGNVSGNAIASEIFVNTTRLDGNLSSEGTVKIGVGTIVVGDIIGSSAVIAGAVKGDIDVNGPVVIDSTAIVQGNIKAKSIQVNNGAVLDGYTSLNYTGVDLKSFFNPEE